MQIQKNKKASVSQVVAVQRKIAAREELIGTMNRQVRLLDETIYQNELEIYRLKKELDTLKAKYAQSIVFAYKNRSNYQFLNFLFSASNFNDAIKRVTYLKSYRKLRETQVSTIQKTQEVLQLKIGTLSTSKKEQSLVLQTQQTQLKDLEEDKKQKNIVVNELKGKEKEVSALLRKKDKQRQDMRIAINAIIKREIAEAARKEKEERIRLAAIEKNKATKPAEITAKATPKTTTSSSTTSSNSGSITPMTTGATSTREYSPLESTPEGVEISINFEKRNLPWL